MGQVNWWKCCTIWPLPFSFLTHLHRLNVIKTSRLACFCLLLSQPWPLNYPMWVTMLLIGCTPPIWNPNNFPSFKILPSLHIHININEYSMNQYYFCLSKDIIVSLPNCCLCVVEMAVLPSNLFLALKLDSIRQFFKGQNYYILGQNLSKLYFPYDIPCPLSSRLNTLFLAFWGQVLKYSPVLILGLLKVSMCLLAPGYHIGQTVNWLPFSPQPAMDSLLIILLQPSFFPLLKVFVFEIVQCFG